MQPRHETFPAYTQWVGPFRLFTHPTRLASAWGPEIMQIHVPPYELPRPEMRIEIADGVTSSRVPVRGGPANILRNIYKKTSPPIEAPDRCLIDARWDTDGNISHVTDQLAYALFVAKKIAPEVTVILRAKATEMAKTAYRLLGLETLCTDREVKGWLVRGASPKRGQLEGYYPELFGAAGFDDYVDDTPKRIFIARRGARSLINQSEVEALLTSRGFETVYYEDMPLSRQWSTTRNAEAIVALHGAALASLVFNDRQVKVVELFHPGYVTHRYRHMTAAVGGQWCGVTGRIDADVIEQLDIKGKARHFAPAPTTIDTGSLELALEHMGLNAADQPHTAPAETTPAPPIAPATLPAD